LVGPGDLLLELRRHGRSRGDTADGAGHIAAGSLHHHFAGRAGDDVLAAIRAHGKLRSRRNVECAERLAAGRTQCIAVELRQRREPGEKRRFAGFQRHADVALEVLAQVGVAGGHALAE
jgi:hypothetical protein